MSLPRVYPQPNPYAATGSLGAGGGSRDSYGAAGARRGGDMPRILKRLFKFPQMDFEVAIWEMLNLMISPRKVVRNLYYQKQTKASAASADPAFPYLMSFFLLLTSLAWSLASVEPSVGRVFRTAVFFVLIHFLGLSLLSALLVYTALPRLFGPGGALASVGRNLALRGRRRGLFGVDGRVGDESVDKLDYGFCFDITIRTFIPLFVHLYVLQFLLLPVLTSTRVLPTLLSNTLHLAAFSHAIYIAFLGYSGLPSLQSTHLLLTPIVALAALWVICSAVGWNSTLHLAPILWVGGGGLRGAPGSAAPAMPPDAAAPPSPPPPAV